MDKFTSKVFSFIKENGMLSPDDSVVAGFSGGADSTALLNVLYELKDILKFRLAAIHINHGIRQEAAEDEEFSRNFCSERGIPFRAVSVDVPALARELKLTEEEAGRRARYEAFNAYAKELSANVIAVAHHQNDVAETLIMNLTRGCGLHGAAAIRPVRDNIIRPLLCVDRNEIEEYLQERNISFCTDMTNFENVHTRNIIRNRIIPELDEGVNPKSVSHMARAAMSFEKADEFIRGYTQKVFAETAEVLGDSVNIDVRALSEEADIIKENVVLMAFEQLVKSRKDIGFAHVDAVLSLMRDMSGTASVDLPYGLKAVRSYDILKLGPAENRTDDGGDINLSLTEGEETEIVIPGLGRARIAVISYDAQKEVPTQTYTKWLDYDRIQAVSFRKRRRDDYIRISQKGELHSKQLSKLMTDEKVPRDERDSMYILCDGDEVLWLPGYRMSDAYKVSGTTKRVLTININKTGGKING
ncbi:tRNA lysidine(34) synthetase TilS [Butyrivibrio sp. XPD2006]|uniref:tRNA lysidine(34) synthetase TilS n=1 Tax=Butyrivibrio sp. XPD2006 TaxID=1280668 RepID=UPI0003B60AAC|nr:tRNA lysidine(34) synthetase TilS [Butyrivibrio sp. XPD2006]